MQPIQLDLLAVQARDARSLIATKAVLPTVSSKSKWSKKIRHTHYEISPSVGVPWGAYLKKDVLQSFR